MLIINNFISSNIDYMFYDGVKQELIVKFGKSKISDLYKYLNINQEVCDIMLESVQNSESAGKFINQKIKPLYKFQKLNRNDKILCDNYFGDKEFDTLINDFLFVYYEMYNVEDFNDVLEKIPNDIITESQQNESKVLTPNGLYVKYLNEYKNDDNMLIIPQSLLEYAKNKNKDIK